MRYYADGYEKLLTLGYTYEKPKSKKLTPGWNVRNFLLSLDVHIYFRYFYSTFFFLFPRLSSPSSRGQFLLLMAVCAHYQFERPMASSVFMHICTAPVTCRRF